MALKFPEAYFSKPTPILSSKTEPKVLSGILTSEEPAINEDQLSETIDRIDLSWLPFAAKTYCISPNIEDYVLKSMPLMPSDIPNRNGVAFPIEELVAFQPPPMNRQVYKSWAYCPVHLEHDNEDHTKALGVILDTSLRPIKNYGNGKHWMVHGLIAIDKNKNPEIAEKVRSGDINTGSMGALADNFTCGVCAKAVSDKTFMNCSHISSTQNVNWEIVDHEGQKKLAYLNAHGLSPIEYSLVKNPAWAMALADGSFSW